MIIIGSRSWDTSLEVDVFFLKLKGEVLAEIGKNADEGRVTVIAIPGDPIRRGDTATRITKKQQKQAGIGLRSKITTCAIGFFLCLIFDLVVSDRVTANLPVLFLVWCNKRKAADVNTIVGDLNSSFFSDEALATEGKPAVKKTSSNAT